MVSPASVAIVGDVPENQGTERRSTSPKAVSPTAAHEGTGADEAVFSDHETDQLDIV